MMRRAALALGLALLAAPGFAQEADVAARVQALRDEADIRTLVLDYGRHLDALDFAAFAALFAADGEYNGRTGPAAIEESMIAAFGPESGAVWTDDFHIVGNIIVELYPGGDADAASATSRWMFVSPGPDGGAGRTVQPVLAGRYVDRFTRTEAGWRFAARALVNDMGMDGFPGVRAGWEGDPAETE